MNRCVECLWREIGFCPYLEENYFMKKFALVLIGMIVASGLANASLLPFLTSGPTGTGPFTYNYSVTLSQDERQDPAATNGPSCGGVPCNPPGTFFTLYDIPGLVVVSSAAGWNAS